MSQLSGIPANLHQVSFDEVGCCAMRRAFKNLSQDQEKTVLLQQIISEEKFQILSNIFSKTIRLFFYAREEIVLFYAEVINYEQEKISVLETEARLECGHTAQEHWDAMDLFLEHTHPERFLN